MSAVRFVVEDFVEVGRVFDAEGAMRVLAMETLLVAIHHGFPVEFAWVLQRATVGKTAEIVSRQQWK